MNTFIFLSQNEWLQLPQRDSHTQPSETLHLQASKQISPAFITYIKSLSTPDKGEYTKYTQVINEHMQYKLLDSHCPHASLPFLLFSQPGHLIPVS